MYRTVRLLEGAAQCLGYGSGDVPMCGRVEGTHALLMREAPPQSARLLLQYSPLQVKHSGAIGYPATGLQRPKTRPHRTTQGKAVRKNCWCHSSRPAGSPNLTAIVLRAFPGWGRWQ